MDEQTLKLAQKLAQESICEQTHDQEAAEASDGHPKPLKTFTTKLEEKVKGFR